MPVLIVVGGFLGAGKTTLLLTAARLLTQRGLRCALITNDQGDELVDTALALERHIDVKEVTGGCFCCRLDDLTEAIVSLREARPDFIFAEPVGSCIDIARTVIRPLREYADGIHVAPFTVLVDPGRKPADAQTDYLFRNQIAEADIVCYSKTDAHDELPSLDGHSPRRISARTGEGVEAWLDDVLQGDAEAGTRLLNVDYSTYAAAEASLGWLNWRGDLSLRTALRPGEVTGRLLEELDTRLTAAGAAIAHMKVLDRTSGAYVKASICSNGEEPDVEGDLFAQVARKHHLLVNVRASCAPEVLERAMDDALQLFRGPVTEHRRQAFRPLVPVP